MRSKPWILILILSMLMCVLPIAAYAADNEGRFVDVSSSAWYSDSIAYISENGLMDGVGNSCFNPEGSTTRGMIVTILWRLEGKPAAAGKSFSDVRSGMYYKEAIDWAAMEGIAEGYTPTVFGPDDPITREQFVVILFRYAERKGYDVSKKADLSAYSDVGLISSYANKAVAWANAAGLLNGTGSSVLDPRGGATRAQAAALFMRFCEQFPGGGTVGAASHKVSFYTGASSNAPYSEIKVEDGSPVAAPIEPALAGYTFVGWYESLDNDEPFDFASVITGDLTLYAKWDKQPAPEGGGSGDDTDPDNASADNLFKIESVLSDDKKTVELTLTLCGTVSLCGFDMRLQYDKTMFALNEWNTNLDIQVFSDSDPENGTVSFNYSNAKNITKAKTILIASFAVLDGAGGTGSFSLTPVEVIMVDGQNGYDVLDAPYTLTTATVSIG